MFGKTPELLDEAFKDNSPTQIKPFVSKAFQEWAARNGLSNSGDKERSIAAVAWMAGASAAFNAAISRKNKTKDDAVLSISDLMEVKI